MNRTAPFTFGRLVAATALAGTLLAGCASTAGAPRADLSAGKAEAALARGNHGAAISNAEAAVQADPRNAAYRAMLGSAYLEAGRFASAATSFDDAMKLGDNSPRTALSLALSLIGQGRHREAAALLNDWEGEIATADLGLALALAGQPERGVHLMGNAIRGGENTAKMRQNLAYAYALSGRWREARLMAQQDVPADQVGARMEEWAGHALPEAWQLRVAALLKVPAGVADQGQPQRLALGNSPAIEQLVAEASAQSASEAAAIPAPPVLADRAPQGELPAIGAVAARELPPLAAPAATPVPAVSMESYPAPAAGRPNSFESAFAAPAPAGGSIAQVAQDAIRFAQSPAVQAAPLRHGAKPMPASARLQRSEGSHLVQLGSFLSEQGARRAWGVYVKQNPELAAHKMVINQAVVNGKTYWRVAAGGFGKADSSAMCGKVRARGAGCFAYAASRPLPGQVDSGIRMARR